jgi:hypothetical protein
LVRGGPGGLEATALIDRDVDGHGAIPHRATSRWSPCDR